MDKSIIVYNLEENEIVRLKNYGFRVTVISSSMTSLKVKEIISGIKDGESSGELPNEKVILLNNYKNTEIQATVKKIRNHVTGGILAVVTPISSNWSFKYLLEHLIEERESFVKQQ
ncbi:MAG: DUF3783 domain-containing protein [Clostridium sp.]